LEDIDEAIDQCQCISDDPTFETVTAEDLVKELQNELNMLCEAAKVNSIETEDLNDTEEAKLLEDLEKNSALGLPVISQDVVDDGTCERDEVVEEVVAVDALLEDCDNGRRVADLEDNFCDIIKSSFSKLSAQACDPSYRMIDECEPIAFDGTDQEIFVPGLGRKKRRKRGRYSVNVRTRGRSTRYVLVPGTTLILFVKLYANFHSFSLITGSAVITSKVDYLRVRSYHLVTAGWKTLMRPLTSVNAFPTILRLNPSLPRI